MYIAVVPLFKHYEAKMKSKFLAMTLGFLMIGSAACAGADGEDGTSCTVVESEDEEDAQIECEDGTSATIEDGTDGTSCSVEDNGDGTKTISCEDGTETTVSDGEDGEDGSTCSVTDNEDGTATIDCEDGSSATISDGEDGAPGDSCTVEDNNDGTSTISCEDGSEATVSDGEDGHSCSVTDHGDGTSTISCEDGTEVTVSDGEDGEDGEDGIDGEDGEDGADGADLVTETFTFPDSSDTYNVSDPANWPESFFLSGEYVEGTRTVTTMSGPAIKFYFDLSITNDLSGSSSCEDETFDYDLIINDEVAGSFSIDHTDTAMEGTAAHLVGVGSSGDVDIRFELTRDIGSGCGAVDIHDSGGSLEISGL